MHTGSGAKRLCSLPVVEQYKAFVLEVKVNNTFTRLLGVDMSHDGDDLGVGTSRTIENTYCKAKGVLLFRQSKMATFVSRGFLSDLHSIVFETPSR